MTGTPKTQGPSVRKRVLLTLFLVLPFLILALLMWTIVFQIDKQGAELRDEPARVESP